MDNKQVYLNQEHTALPRRISNSGFSLIEVMISALIISVSLLGLSAMQITAGKGTHQSFMKQKASDIMQDMVERMRINPAAVKTQDYTFDSQTLSCSATPNCSTASCSSSKIAEFDIKNIVCGAIKKVPSQSQLPALLAGRMVVSCQPPAAGILANCASGDVILRLEWKERIEGADTTNATKTRTIEINTRI